MTCQHCTAAGTDPYLLTRGPGCLDCEARHVAIAAMQWTPPKHAPGRNRWHAIRDLMAVIWRDEAKRQQARPLVWRWVLRLKRAEVVQ